MPTYFPIDIGVKFDCARSDLLHIDWNANALVAIFSLPDDTRDVRIRFEGMTIIRVLEEFALSTEIDVSEVEGLVLHHFAYRVEGSTFAATQSKVWMEAFGPVTHYEFITGSGCLDVLSCHEPSYDVMPGENCL